jgi:hypothetical protein
MIGLTSDTGETLIPLSDGAANRSHGLPADHTDNACLLAAYSVLQFAPYVFRFFAGVAFDVQFHEFFDGDRFHLHLTSTNHRMRAYPPVPG